MNIMRKHFNACFAGLVFEFDTPSTCTCVLCRDYLCDGSPDIKITVTQDDVNTMMIGPVRHTKVSATTTAVHIKVIEAIAEKGIFMLHGASIATDNCAYIFTAPSGVGKSTRAKIWLDEYPGSFIVNGDKPLIKITEDSVLACGTPWCGNEGWNTNTMVPLQAIFLLERADEGEKSNIEEVSLGKAFSVLLQQIYRPSDPALMRKTIELLKALDGKVKFYRFRSTPTPEAICLAYETARPR